MVAGVAISNGDKVLYPEDGITKRTLARYYEAIGELMLPHVAGRPLTLVRCPNGWDKHCFYQKHAKESVSEFIDRIDIREDGSEQPYMVANSVSALVALLQMGVLEVHPWGSRAPKLSHPDRLDSPLSGVFKAFPYRRCGGCRARPLPRRAASGHHGCTITIWPG